MPMEGAGVIHKSSTQESFICDCARASSAMYFCLQETVIAGEVVTFHIADNLLAAKQAEKLGAPVSRLIGMSLAPIPFLFWRPVDPDHGSRIA